MDREEIRRRLWAEEGVEIEPVMERRMNTLPGGHPMPHVLLPDIYKETTMEQSETDELLGFFAYEHLPPHIQKFSKPFGETARQMVADLGHLPTGQVNEGLKDLLRAKDCFVRASLKLPKEG